MDENIHGEATLTHLITNDRCFSSITVCMKLLHIKSTAWVLFHFLNSLLENLSDLWLFLKVVIKPKMYKDKFRKCALICIYERQNCHTQIFHPKM